MLRVGVDELGTGTQHLYGYAYLMLPEQSCQQFVSEFRELSLPTGRNAFHGREFRPGDRDSYMAFFKLIEKHLTESGPSLFCLTLDSQQTRQILNDSFAELFKNAISQATESVRVPIFNEREYEILNHVLCYLIRFLRVSCHLNAASEELAIEIDADESSKKLTTLKTTIQGCDFTALWFLVQFLNKYRNKLFPGAPVISEDVKVLPDEESPLIQAADVFGNFLLAHISVCKKENPSRTSKLKSDILLKIFGSSVTLGTTDLDKVRLVGSHDLELTESEAFTFKLWRIKQPSFCKLFISSLGLLLRSFLHIQVRHF